MNHGTPEVMSRKLDQVASLADTMDHLSKSMDGRGSSIASQLREILEDDQLTLDVPVPSAADDA